MVGSRSEEHTSELQSRQYLVCRLLLEKKKKRGGIEPTRGAQTTYERLWSWSAAPRRPRVPPRVPRGRPLLCTSGHLSLFFFLKNGPPPGLPPFPSPSPLRG